jgi:hypothetical protein
MSKSMIIAIVAVSTLFIINAVFSVIALVGGTTTSLRVIITGGLLGLILIGIIKGHRLAWQWGRVLGLLSAVLASFIAIALIFAQTPKSGTVVVEIIFGLQAILLYVLFFALGTAGAKAHFRLVCSACGSMKTKAANFSFTKAKCKACKNEW